MKKIKTISNTIVISLLLIICLFNTVMFYQNYIDKNNTSFFSFYIFKVGSGSMLPKLYVGDYILVRQYDNYYIGDVVTYEKDGAFITHRIIDVDENGLLILKGDNNNTVDSKINMEQVRGKYIYTFKILSFLEEFPIIKYLLIFLLVLWLTISIFI